MSAAQPSLPIEGQLLPPPPQTTKAQLPPPPTQYGIQITQRSERTAYLWSLIFGISGAHQFYLGNTKRGFVYLFTLGGFGFAVLYDWFTMAKQVQKANEEIRTGVRTG